MRWLLLSVFVVLIDAQESDYAGGGAATYSTGAKSSLDIAKVSGEANRVRAQETLFGEALHPTAPDARAGPSRRTRPLGAQGRKEEPLTGYGTERSKAGHDEQGRETLEHESESFPDKLVGDHYKVDSVTSELTKEKAFAKKPPFTPPRAQIPPLTEQSSLMPPPSSTPSSESPEKPGLEREETAPPAPPSVPSPAYPEPTSSKSPGSSEEGFGGAESSEGTSPSSISEPSPAASDKKSGEGPGQSQTISVVVPPMPSRKEESSTGRAQGEADAEKMEPGSEEESSTSEELPEAGKAPAYPESSGVIHSPSPTHADRVLSEAVTTPQPREVYQHPPGKLAAPTGAVSSSSAQTSSEESSSIALPTSPTESMKSTEPSSLFSPPEDHKPLQFGDKYEAEPESDDSKASKETSSKGISTGPKAVVSGNEALSEGSAQSGPEVAGGMASSGPSPLQAPEGNSSTMEAEGSAEPESVNEEGEAGTSKEQSSKAAAGGEQVKLPAEGKGAETSADAYKEKGGEGIVNDGHGDNTQKSPISEEKSTGSEEHTSEGGKGAQDSSAEGSNLKQPSKDGSNGGTEAKTGTESEHMYTRGTLGGQMGTSEPDGADESNGEAATKRTGDEDEALKEEAAGKDGEPDASTSKEKSVTGGSEAKQGEDDKEYSSGGTEEAEKQQEEGGKEADDEVGQEESSAKGGLEDKKDSQDKEEPEDGEKSPPGPVKETSEQEGAGEGHSTDEQYENPEGAEKTEVPEEHEKGGEGEPGKGERTESDKEGSEDQQYAQSSVSEEDHPAMTGKGSAATEGAEETAGNEEKELKYEQREGAEANQGNPSSGQETPSGTATAGGGTGESEPGSVEDAKAEPGGAGEAPSKTGPGTVAKIPSETGSGVGGKAVSETRRGGKDKHTKESESSEESGEKSKSSEESEEKEDGKRRELPGAEVDGDARNAGGTRAAGGSESFEPRYVQEAPEAEGGTERKLPLEGEGDKLKTVEGSSGKPIGEEEGKTDQVSTASDGIGTSGGEGDSESGTEQAEYETGVKKIDEETKNKETGGGGSAPGPFVKIDSTSRGKNIIIAYTPNKQNKRPNINKSGHGKKNKTHVVKSTSSSYVKGPLTSPARDAKVASFDPLADDVFKALEKTMSSSTFTIEHNSPREGSVKELMEEHNEPGKAASSLSFSKSTNHTEQSTASPKPQKLMKEAHPADIARTKTQSRLFERLRPHKERSVLEFPRPKPLESKIASEKKKKTKKFFPGNFPTPRNLTDLTASSDFPKPANLPVPSDIPMLKKVIIKMEPHDFPKPSKLPGPISSTAIPKSESLRINKTLPTFPKPKKLPNKEFPLNFPNPDNITSGNFVGVFPRPASLPAKNTFKIFPKPETLPTKEFPLNFPEPRTTLPIPLESESIDESPNNVSFVNFPKPSNLTIAMKLPEPNQMVKKLPLSNFPLPGNFSDNSLLLNFTKPGRLIATPRWRGFHRPQELLTSESDSLTIALPSGDHSKSETAFTDSTSPSRPIFLNVPFPQPLPLNVTVTHKKVRRHKKKSYRKRVTIKLHHKRKREEKFDSEKSFVRKKTPWKINMIPKPLLKVRSSQPLPNESLIEPEQDRLESTPLPDLLDESSSRSRVVDGVAESIDEPISVKSGNDEEIPPTTVETTTEWMYATAPGERTAAPEILAAQAAEDSVVTFVDKPLVIQSPVPKQVDPKEQLENSVEEPEVLATTEHYVVAPEPFLPHGSFRPNISLITADSYGSNELEPSGYTSNTEPVPEFSPDLPHTEAEEVVNSSDNSSKAKASHNSSKGKGGKRSDLPVASSKESPLPSKELIRKVIPQLAETVSSTDATITSTLLRKWTPYQMDCATEVDDKGSLCKEWAEGGLCTISRPTMFLFCRKTCLCGGPEA